MKALRLHAPCFLRWSRFALVLILTAPAAPVRADPPVPTLDEQIQLAQTDHDKESVVELCRRRLAAPGADAIQLLRTIFQAQLDLKDLPRAAQTLDALAKIPAPAALVAESRGDLASAQPAGQGLDAALAAWNEALAADPENLAGLRGKIADALDAAGRWEEAAGAFRAALRMSPGHPARQARLAVCLLNAGHAADADKVMQAAVRADAADDTVKAAAPTFDRLRPQLPALLKLEARLAAGPRPAGANAAPDVSPGANTLESASLDRALILYRAGSPAGALADARRALDGSDGKSRAAGLLTGQCLWELAREKEAVALGVARLADKKWFVDDARFGRLRVADRAPGLTAAVAVVRAYTVRATILLEANQPVLALADAREAHGVNDAQHLRLDDPEVVFAVALLRNGQAAAALAAARRATEYAPNNPDGWAVLGRVEQETRADFAAAAEHLTRALSLQEDARWLHRRETCLRSLGRNAEADRDARRLAQLPPVS